MANSFVTVKEIARQALPRLIENLVFPNLIYKDFKNDFVGKKGTTIQVRKPVKYTAADFSGNVSTQDMKEDSVTVKLDRIADVSVEYSSLESASNVDDLNRLFVAPAAVALAQKINSDGLSMYKAVANFCGTAGTTPSALTDLAAVRKALNIAKVPEAGRIAVWDPEADAAFTTIPAVVNAEKSGTTAALRNGSIGRVMGLDNYMSQAVVKHKTGITGSTAVKVNGVVAAGSDTVNLDGTKLEGKLLKGDLLKIDGVCYTVAEDSASAASNAIAGVKIYPAAEKGIADNADVTLIGDHTANLAFNPLAFAFVTRPLSSPSGVDSYVTSYNGISLRVVKGYDMSTKKEMLSMDVLYDYAPIYPEMAVRVLG